jgi:RNA polymerase sigma factor (sigma-70 family)
MNEMSSALADDVEETDTPAAADSGAGGQPNWGQLVERIQRDEQVALEELYRIFSRGMRYYLCRQLGPQDLDDKVHDCFLLVVQAVQRGELREPERLMGFARTIVRRQIAGHIDLAVQNRRQQIDLDSTAPLPDGGMSPEAVAMTRQEEELAVSVLKGISRRDREILTRFYLEEQTQEQICSDMKLTETQFRLLKSRAKARFGELGRRKLSRKNFKVF